MAVVTGVEAQVRDPERVNVYLDGNFAFGASLLVAVTHGIKVGIELTEAQVTALREDDEVEKGFNAALNFLSYRPRSRREITDYFRRKGTEAAAVSAILERLERIGLVDDREFAKFWVENRLTHRPRGSRALRAEMIGKGLSREVIDETLAGLTGEEEMAYEAGLRNQRKLARLDEREFFRKMVAYLQRRGFPYEIASSATRRLLEEGGLSFEDDVTGE